MGYLKPALNCYKVHPISRPIGCIGMDFEDNWPRIFNTRINFVFTNSLKWILDMDWIYFFLFQSFKTIFQVKYVNDDLKRIHSWLK